MKTRFPLLLAALLACSAHAQNDATATEEAGPVEDRIRPAEEAANQALQTTAPRFICNYAQRERRIEVVYTNPPQQVPCQVQYFKDTEEPGNMQVLWSANDEIGYCETQAEQLAERLRGFGWECERL